VADVPIGPRFCLTGHLANRSATIAPTSTKRRKKKNGPTIAARVDRQPERCQAEARLRAGWLEFGFPLGQSPLCRLAYCFGRSTASEAWRSSVAASVAVCKVFAPAAVAHHKGLDRATR
jgi:hypothetical protein